MLENTLLMDWLKWNPLVGMQEKVHKSVYYGNLDKLIWGLYHLQNEFVCQVWKAEDTLEKAGVQSQRFDTP